MGGSLKKQVEVDGVSYIWNGKFWVNSRTFLAPPRAVESILNQKLSRELSIEDAKETNPEVLLKNARIARDNCQYQRALELCYRVLAMRSGHLGVAAVLCSVLRSKGMPERALHETQAFKGRAYIPLLVSRAAAMCDLEMWEDAKKEIGKALAVPGAHESAFAVVNRIKAARPNLYNSN